MSSIDLLLSMDGGELCAGDDRDEEHAGQPVGLVEWTIPDVSTTQAQLKLVARDLIGNVTSAVTGNHRILGSAEDTYEEVYVHDYDSVRTARQGLERYFQYYNQQRQHQSLSYRTPAEVYFGA